MHPPSPSVCRPAPGTGPARAAALKASACARWGTPGPTAGAASLPSALRVASVSPCRWCKGPSPLAAPAGTAFATVTRRVWTAGAGPLGVLPASALHPTGRPQHPGARFVSASESEPPVQAAIRPCLPLSRASCQWEKLAAAPASSCSRVSLWPDFSRRSSQLRW